ncbi:phage head morphogenesis protein [Xylanimonas oleitrophica]|uniref:Phage head morphogenesis protein n=1 Tax=Xylanimonas oleitrophica TaxID=2607479 RepID=A0A2W5WX46_9MICO|nr:phage minor head protein [Xylanimonas oleitrophica]PZR55233.1 phage head morphogenesis protein [Xylanimonas oleitrophica]
MAVNRETLRLARGMRVQLDRTVDAATRDMVAAWVKAWDDLAAQWETVVAELVEYTQENGTWPPAWRIARAERVAQAVNATRDRLDDLTANAGVRILQDVPAITDAAAEWQARIIAAQMPRASVAGDYAVAATFDRLDAAALDAIVRRTTSQVTALTIPLSDEATDSMVRHLVRGVTVGDNPRTAARRMLRGLEGGFNGGLSRAMTIARTEMLDAHREASRAARRANADVLTGWQWIAELSHRTCPSCLAQHGSIHPVEEPGPIDHQNGRCTALPVTKSWADLGFDIEEPESTLPDARAWFDSLPEKEQLAVMGPERLRLLRAGQIGWDDLSQRRSTPGWRDSYGVTPVRDLLPAAS